LTIIQAIAFIVGYYLQDIKRALLIGLGGTVLAFLLIVPPWPFFNRHPVNWLKEGGKKAASQGIVVDGKLVG
jgi:signal peptidase complex subunit 1